MHGHVGCVPDTSLGRTLGHRTAWHNTSFDALAPKPPQSKAQQLPHQGSTHSLRALCHGGVCISVLDTNPRSVGRGGGGPGGGQSKIFLHFAGIFEFPISF